MMLRALAILAFLATGFGAEARPQLPFGPAVVTLSGTMVTEPFYGPPNFGENPATDKKVQVLEIKLDKPVDVIGTPGNLFESASYSAVTRIGLVDLQFKARNIERYMGQHITVTGTLWAKDNALQYVKVLLTVGTIHASGKPQ